MSILHRPHAVQLIYASAYRSIGRYRRSNHRKSLTSLNTSVLYVYFRLTATTTPPGHIRDSVRDTRQGAHISAPLPPPCGENPSYATAAVCHARLASPAAQHGRHRQSITISAPWRRRRNPRRPVQAAADADRPSAGIDSRTDNGSQIRRAAAAAAAKMPHPARYSVSLSPAAPLWKPTAHTHTRACLTVRDYPGEQVPER